MPERAMAQMATAQRHVLEAYLDELERWRGRINLSAVPRHLAWQRHVEQSAMLLDAVAAGPGAALIDIGSGAGLPGIVAAVLRPDLHVTLLESDLRKAGFLTHVCGSLRLGNVMVDARRAEAAGHDPATRDHFDVAVSRAAASPPVLCELALPLLRPGGALWALTSSPAEAAASCRAASRLCGGGEPRAVGTELLRVDKESASPERYPRRSGVPARRPLL